MMTNSTTFVTGQVPYLRRFARVLTGSQTAGDSYALAALKAATAKPAAFQSPLDARRALYRALLTLWTQTADRAGALGCNPDPIVSPVDFNLTAVAPLPRAAFLLQSMEQFRTDQVAVILQRSVPEVECLIDQAGEELAAQIRTNILILEDESLISTDLRELVEELGHSVPHVARTCQEAVSLARHCHPGLVLADVHLAGDSSGIEAVNEIVTCYDVPVVFITAFPEELLTVERPEPSFLVTKPYRAATIKAVISQALFFDIYAHGPTMQALS